MFHQQKVGLFMDQANLSILTKPLWKMVNVKLPRACNFLPRSDQMIPEKGRLYKCLKPEPRFLPFFPCDTG